VKRDDKTAVIDSLSEEFKSTDTIFVADYRGLSVSGITALRDRLRPTDASFRVVKNTLARIAAEQAGYEDVADLFVGPSAVAFVRGDAAAVAKALDQVSKETNGVLELRGGLMDGRKVDEAQVKDIAKLPPREVILALLVSAVNAPMVQTVGVLSAPMRDIVMILDAYIEKRQKEEGAAA